MKQSLKRQEQQAAIEHLRELLKPGDTVQTILRHVSRSGMQREISTLINTPDGIRNISYYVSLALDQKPSEYNGHNTVKVNGVGMDMGYHVVYNLSSVLFPKGFKLPDGAYGRNGDTSGYDTDGGYALKQEWL